MTPNIVHYLWILLGFPLLYSLASARKLPNHLSRARILSEWKEIKKNSLDLSVPFNDSDESDYGIRLSPLKSNLLEWHFSFLGMKGSNFEGGIYHGKIMLDPEYPRKAPVITISTPSGRWETNSPICLSATAHHQELWNPDWNLKTLVMSLRSFMISPPGEIGSIFSSVERQQLLAKASHSYVCKQCGAQHEYLSTKTSCSLPIESESRNINYRTKLAKNTKRKTKVFKPNQLSKVTLFSAIVKNVCRKSFFAAVISAALVFSLKFMYY